VRNFGPDYKPEPYIEQAYKDALKHKWYMTSRLITVNDLYSFDQTSSCTWKTSKTFWAAISGSREEGLGFDNSPVAHMWRHADVADAVSLAFRDEA